MVNTTSNSNGPTSEKVALLNDLLEAERNKKVQDLHRIQTLLNIKEDVLALDYLDNG